jgi:hypothetical protein
MATRHVRLFQIVKADRLALAGKDAVRVCTHADLRAVVVDPPERGIEGDYWLCEIQGPASQAMSRQTNGHATDLLDRRGMVDCAHQVVSPYMYYRHLSA